MWLKLYPHDVVMPPMRGLDLSKNDCIAQNVDQRSMVSSDHIQESRIAYNLCTAKPNSKPANMEENT